MTTLRAGSSARRTRTVTHRDIELVTEITGDRNPLHHDDALAARSRFGGIVVPGGVTSGLLNALVAEQMPGPGSVIPEVSRRFLAPVLEVRAHLAWAQGRDQDAAALTAGAARLFRLAGHVLDAERCETASSPRVAPLLG
jgi:acyl dehydratase